MSHSLDLSGEQEVGATHPPFLKREHKRTQTRTPPAPGRQGFTRCTIVFLRRKTSQCCLPQRRCSWGPATSLGLFTLQPQNWPRMACLPPPFQCGLQLAVTFRANSEKASDLGRNVGNVWSQGQPPPTCGPGMWAMSHLWPPREVHTHTWLEEKGECKVQEWNSWEAVWQNSYITQRAKSDCQCQPPCVLSRLWVP